MHTAISNIPILTTVFAIFFSAEIIRHYQQRRTAYLLWWTIGVISFGLGTLAESIHALAGWNAVNLKYWYITGALLGGFPLAQGSVHLLLSRRFARYSSVFFVALIAIAAICVVLTPVDPHPELGGRLTGQYFAWSWVRAFSPFINIYSFLFLVGGAIYSAIRYYRGGRQVQFKGNILIALGGLLPGIGGTATRMGHVEVLFVTELIGLILIYLGYRTIKRSRFGNIPVAA
jgi:hypothetical protein